MSSEKICLSILLTFLYLQEKKIGGKDSNSVQIEILVVKHRNILSDKSIGVYRDRIWWERSYRNIFFFFLVFSEIIYIPMFGLCGLRLMGFSVTRELISQEGFWTKQSCTELILWCIWTSVLGLNSAFFFVLMVDVVIVENCLLSLRIQLSGFVICFVGYSLVHPDKTRVKI